MITLDVSARKLVLPGLLAAVAAVELLGMPRFWYPGDNWVARSEAIQLVEHGELGIAYDAPDRPDQDERGKYWVENDARRRMYSKYGFGYTLVYLPVVLLERALQGEIRPASPSLFIAINVYDALFAVGIAWYLYRLARRFDRGPVVPAIFVVAVLYASFVWHYLRSPTLEVYQLFFFAAYSVHAILFDLYASHRITARRASLHLLAASASAGMMTLFRPTFALLFVPLALLAASSGRSRPGRWTERVAENLRLRGAALAVAGGGPMVLFLGIWLAVNAIRTGSPFDSGYQQWVGPDGLPVARFTLRALPAAAAGLLLQPGNANVFLHHPVLPFALAGWPAFAARHRRQALFLGAVVLMSAGPLLFLSNWRGEWCYGPRYFVHALLAASLPLVVFLRWVTRQRTAPRIAGASIFGAIAVASLVLQLEMNSLHYFAYHYASASVRRPGEFEEYLSGPRFRPLYVPSFRRFLDDGGPFTPVDSALERIPEPARRLARERVRRDLSALREPNWYLAAPRAGGAP